MKILLWWKPATIVVLAVIALHFAYLVSWTTSMAGQIAGPVSLERWYSSKVSYLLEDLERVATIVGIVIGGVWVYFNFLRGRTYAPRLIVTVAPSVVRANGKTYVNARITVQNVGLSRVFIEQNGTTCDVNSLLVSEEESEPRLVVDWELFNMSRLFDKVPLIEAGVAIVEHYLLEIPDNGPKVWKIAARIVVVDKNDNTEWNGANIVIISPALPPERISNE